MSQQTSQRCNAERDHEGGHRQESKVKLRVVFDQQLARKWRLQPSHCKEVNSAIVKVEKDLSFIWNYSFKHCLISA